MNQYLFVIKYQGEGSLTVEREQWKYIELIKHIFDKNKTQVNTQKINK